MTNLTATRPYVKPLLTLHWQYPILRIDANGHQDVFDVAEADARHGRAFQLASPHNPEDYILTFISDYGQNEDRCTCLESLAGRCCHMSAVGHLVREGLIESPYVAMPSAAQGDAPF
jgi:hypothetical protein